MNTLITAVVSIIIGAIINELIRYFVPVWKKSIKDTLPKRQSNRLRLKIAIKYPFLIAFIFLIFFWVPEGKWFVLAVSGVVVVISFFIARDFYVYYIKMFVWAMERDSLETEKDRWLNSLLAHNSPKDEKVVHIRSKIKEIEDKLARL